MRQIRSADDIIRNMPEWENDHPIIRTGFPLLDGHPAVVLREGCLSLVGGRPFMGKTMFAVNIAANAAQEGRKVYFVSLLESAEQIALKFAETGISQQGMENILIDDTEYTPFAARELVSAIRRISADTSLIIINDVQHLGPENVQWLQGAFPNAAVLLLSQADRAVDEREDHRVGLRDIRGFDQYGAYIDCAFSVYRKDFYSEEEQKTNLFEVICLKSKGQKVSVLLDQEGYVLKKSISAE